MELETQTPPPGSSPAADRPANGAPAEAAARDARPAPGSISQTGATLFSELVWAHHRWQRELAADGEPDAAVEEAYRKKLTEFQEKEGDLEQVYWSTRDASAVAITVKEGRRTRSRVHLRDRDDIIRLHRLTDWVTRDSPAIADLLHECDVMAIRVGEILRGTSERIAMRWILGIEAHLLGFFERGSMDPPAEAEAELVRVQRARLAELEDYYQAAASKAGRIVYVSGMLIGAAIVAVLGALAAVLLDFTRLDRTELELLMLCFGAGGIGALVSAVSRMGRSERGGFNVDFELGRPLMRRLGVYRPFVGAVFGVVLYFLLKSGILDLTFSDAERPYYFGFAAFLAGFSERFATVLFGAAEQKLAGHAPVTQTPETDRAS